MEGSPLNRMDRRRFRTQYKAQGVQRAFKRLEGKQPDAWKDFPLMSVEAPTSHRSGALKSKAGEGRELSGCHSLCKEQYIFPSRTAFRLLTRKGGGGSFSFGRMPS